MNNLRCLSNRRNQKRIPRAEKSVSLSVSQVFSVSLIRFRGQCVTQG